MEKSSSSSLPPYELAPGHGPPQSSSSSTNPSPQPVTYTLSITSKAIRSFSSPDLPARLVAAHRAFDPSVPASSIRVITSFLHNAHGNWLYVGGSRADMMHYRYVRVVVEVPVGEGEGMTVERKGELMRRVAGEVEQYAGKRAKETEVDVVVREVGRGDEVWRTL